MAVWAVWSWSSCPAVAVCFFVVAWSFPPALGFLGRTFCGRAPTQEPRRVGYFRCLYTPSRCMVWWRRQGRLHGIGGDMFVCGIIYSPSGCLFDSCVFSVVATSKVSAGSTSMGPSTRGEVLDATRNLWRTVGSNWLPGFTVDLALGFSVQSFYLDALFLALPGLLLRKVYGSALRQYAVMDLSKAVQLKCSTPAPGDVNHLVTVWRTRRSDSRDRSLFRLLVLWASPAESI